MPESSSPLAGLRVLDLSRLLPGPYATLVLADLGATVDTVEDPEVGDATRHMPPHREGEGALYYGLHRNKRSLTLNLKTPEGRDALLRLVSRYDVLVESFRPGVMDKLGVGEAVLRQKNPRLIYCAISGYGQTGPDRLKAGHDLNYVARAGLLGYGGEAGGAPAFPGVQVADIGGGSLFALVGILAALHERERTGVGRFVDVSMTDGALAFLHLHLASRLFMGKEGTPLARGSEALNGGYPSYGLYRTADDRWLAVGALEPKFFGALCAKLGRPELLDDAYSGGEDSARVKAELTRVFASQPLAHWREQLSGAEFCVEPVSEGDEVLADPQLRARGLFVETDDAQRGIRVTHLLTPLRMGDVALRPPPTLGQHSRVILEDAGFTAEEISRLIA
ncbi:MULTISPECIES: CaiB/BaiF CoA transferase family protein [unclassified Corallococcus]|uniref:CaiB/BaiF CoA transferase family protein n=1 Tax=unclassified Corallococcus TaxID=2685029 RepID=UPI001A8D3209|nr:MULTISPECIES: CaiB/BaiF CoA-transferase family protein [unclassified Corallococcus]MBN9684254.1 CoA transferase [Corallococcus sp. NCSPR001]WAS84262.1 CaiB/BaiF CoA-transferase family protein [Corallococcus sp. NCRR]